MLLRVGIDLDGSLESLGNSMTDLANALTATGECELVRFRTLSKPETGEISLGSLQALWRPLWRRSLGPSLDTPLRTVQIVHLAGVATPPSKKIPLIISVDDLRPLRQESRLHLRRKQLQRAVDRGATLVTSSRTARLEVMSVLRVERSRVRVVSPAVPIVPQTIDGTDLVVNITGMAQRFEELAPTLLKFCKRHNTRLVAVTSSSVQKSLRSLSEEIIWVPRREAASALKRARIAMHISDGARFPSFAIAALSAGVPTVARATDINRELLSGAALLLNARDPLAEALESLWNDEAKRSLMIAGGHARAFDFAPSTVAKAYVALYRDVVGGLQGEA